MNSINRQQPENNRKDLTSQEAVDEIKRLVEKAETCFFCTSIPKGESGGARPMSVRKVDEEGNLWFLMANDCHAFREISADPHVKLFFQGSAHSSFLHLDGRASIETTPAHIDTLWTPIVKTWFTAGKEDPRIAVVKVTPSDGYYWDTKHGEYVAGIKMLIGAMVGRTMDDSIEGKVRV